MNQITGINIARLTNAAHFAFMRKAAALAEGLTDQYAAAAHARLAASLHAEDEAYRQSQKSPLTEQIAQADGARDTAYTAIKQVAEALAPVQGQPTTEAARLIAQHIVDYNVDPRAPLEGQTGALYNFLQALRTSGTAHQRAIDTLGLRHLVEQCHTANEAVYQLTLQRTTEQATLTTGALRAARLATDEAYRALQRTIESVQWLTPTPEGSGVIRQLNALIRYYRLHELGETLPPTEGGTEQDGDTEQGGDTEQTGGTEQDGGTEQGSDQPEQGGGTPPPPTGDDGEIVG